jgi:Uma2 family endonuclease
MTCSNAWRLLQDWGNESGLGIAVIAPGLIFAADDDVVPDVVWISHVRLAEALDAAGHLRAPPELVVEMLSPGSENERRDREIKLKLYSQRGVDEYWIADRRSWTVAVYRRDGEALVLVALLTAGDLLTSPLLRGFSHPVADLFRGLPAPGAWPVDSAT